jgi:pimeloyl-ACP methyl ester carboxylesterase
MKKTIINIALSLIIWIVVAACGSKEKSSQSDVKTISPDTLSSEVVKPAFRNGYADVNGIKMYYEVYGEGQPIVLIHGGGSTIQSSFEKIIPGLSKNRQVIGVELQAHGRTGDRNKPLSFEQDADDVAALLKSLNIEKADFLGFSNGANTTMQIAIRHPHLVDKIIAASGFYKRAGMHPQFWETMKKATIKDMPKELKEAFLKVTPDSAKLQNVFQKDSRRMLGFKDWDDQLLKSIQSKTLVVTGNMDVAKIEHTVEMYQLIPHAQLLVIPGGHGEYMGEISFQNTERNVESFVDLIDKFLSE